MIPHHRRRAFTLIELLTVIAIVGILAAIIVPVVGSVRGKARTTQCASNVRQIATAMLLYANENKQLLPKAEGSNSWVIKISSYLSIPPGTVGPPPLPRIAGVLVCPAYSGDPALRDMNYGLNSAIEDKALNPYWQYKMNVPAPARTILLAELQANSEIVTPAQTVTNKAVRRHANDSANYGFVDGHVETIAGILDPADPRWYRFPSNP